MSNDVLAVVCADIHLSHKPPVARSADPDWYEAMSRPLLELKGLKEEYEVPILCAGDVFDRWNSPPELINFAILNLPEMYAVAGQHDLPNHNYAEVKKSAYGTLVLAGNIRPVKGLTNTNFHLSGLDWGDSEIKGTHQYFDGLQVVLIHDYLWTDGFGGYPGAPEEKKAENRLKQLEGYDVAVFGDNHTPFSYQWCDNDKLGCLMYNCGSLMRRTIDQIEHKPSVGLLKSDGSIERYYLDCSEDKFIDDEIIELANDDAKVSQFISSLDKIEGDYSDFSGMLQRYLRMMKIEEGTKKILREVAESVCHR